MDSICTHVLCNYFSFNELEHLSFGAVLVAFIMASFSIVATNGGIGSYPLAIFAAFSLYGISREPSIAFGGWLGCANTNGCRFGRIKFIYSTCSE